MPSLCYLSTSRLHRDRANLVQTLKTAAAFTRLGIECRLFIGPWHGGADVLKQRLDEFHAKDLEIRRTQFLHSRWPVSWFARIYRGKLKQCDAVYIRNPKLCPALVSAGIQHHLEVHSLRQLTKRASLEFICDAHRRGHIGWLFPISRQASDGLITSGADPSRVQTVPSGVDVALFVKVRPFSPPKSLPRVLYAGTLSRDRGLDILEAVAASGVAEVTLVGRQDKGCPPPVHCRYRPPVQHNEVPSLYNEADYVLLPYQGDLEHADAISPIKLFEALATGRPIIASDLPPIREVLTHEKNALLVVSTDPDSWIAAVQRLLSDPELAMKLASSGPAIAAGYSWESRASCILERLFPGSY